MNYEKEREVEEDPFFNMARKTLEGIDKIKQQMLFNDQFYPYDSIEKQKLYIELLKKFYMFAVPLFPKKDDELANMEDEVLDLELEKRKEVKQKTQTDRYFYSKELEKKLNKIFIRISKILKPFLMPIKRDDEGL